MSAPRVVIVGHVEWVTHALGRLPGRGRIADLAQPLTEPAGGGGVAAAAAARLGAQAVLLTAMGNDEAATRSRGELADRGVEIVAAHRDERQTPVLTITEADAERTIMVVGDRLQACAADAIHVGALEGAAAAYYTGEDPDLLAAVRGAVPILVATGRRTGDLAAAGVRADVVVASAHDPDEDPGRLPPELAPAHIVLTEGAQGGSITDASGAIHRYQPVPPPGPVVDTYGCGDTFAAGLTVGLGRGLGIAQAAALGASAAATCATWRGGLGPA